MNKPLIEKIEPELRNMLGSGRIEPEVYSQLTSIINVKATEWAEEMADDFREKARDWETLMGPDQEGFYSLGMRRCADYITGKSELDDA
jgi:hypothetical protein